MPKGWHRETLIVQSGLEREPVPIVWDAVVAVQGIASGRMIPLVIIDTTRRPDIDEMVRLHEHLGPGDAATAWSKPSRWNDDRIRLIVQVMKPTKCTIILEFDLARWAGTVDQVVTAQGVYIQPGRNGDRLVTTPDKPRILVEVPSREFQKEWERIFHKAAVKEFRRRGMNRASAKQAAERFVTQWRTSLAVRLRSN